MSLLPVANVVVSFVTNVLPLFWKSRTRFASLKPAGSDPTCVAVRLEQAVPVDGQRAAADTGEHVAVELELLVVHRLRGRNEEQRRTRHQQEGQEQETPPLRGSPSPQSVVLSSRLLPFPQPQRNAPARTSGRDHAMRRSGLNVPRTWCYPLPQFFRSVEAPRRSELIHTPKAGYDWDRIGRRRHSPDLWSYCPSPRAAGIAVGGALELVP